MCVQCALSTPSTVLGQLVGNHATIGKTQLTDVVVTRVIVAIPPPPPAPPGEESAFAAVAIVVVVVVGKGTLRNAVLVRLYSVDNIAVRTVQQVRWKYIFGP